MRTPWDALYAFYLVHRLCSGLDGGVEHGPVDDV
jgi:hypothetical protein